ncbi:MAG: hypothetical protein ACP5OE_06235 [Thermodesulfobium sp.]
MLLFVSIAVVHIISTINKQSKAKKVAGLFSEMSMISIPLYSACHTNHIQMQNIDEKTKILLMEYNSTLKDKMTEAKQASRQNPSIFGEELYSKIEKLLNKTFDQVTYMSMNNSCPRDPINSEEYEQIANETEKNAPRLI